MRTAYRVYGKRIKEIAPETEHSKNTVKKALQEEFSDELIETHEEKHLNGLRQRYSCCGLLIIYKPGYVPFTKEGAELLSQVFTDRHERGVISDN